MAEETKGNLENLTVGDVLEILNGLKVIAGMSIKNLQLRWLITKNLRLAKDIGTQYDGMLSEIKPEKRNALDKEVRDLLKVQPKEIFTPIKKSDIDSIPGIEDKSNAVSDMFLLLID